MRRLFCCAVPRWALTLAGVAAITVALAAWQLGLDNNPVMGPSRILLLLWGIGILIVAQHGLVAALLRGGRNRTATQSGTDRFPPDQRLAKPYGAEVRPSPRWIWPALFLTFPAILALYLWLVTAGEWMKPLPETTFYYDMLAEALASGQTFLKHTPDPRLAEVGNPYDPALLIGIARCEPGIVRQDCWLMDASYFEGKYYLYWGPAPAAGLALLKIGGVGRVGDVTIALIAASALFCLTAYCLAGLWNRYFSGLPRWLLFPPLVLAGLAYPLPWVLDDPRIYEAATLQGAALLMWGFAVAVPAFASGHSGPRRLALVGALWGLALGTRAVLALPVAVLASGLAWRVFRGQSADPGVRGLWSSMADLFLPLAAAAGLIGVYNYVRYSNPLEFGTRYMLGPSTVQTAGSLTAFDWSHIPVNAYNYLFAPAAIGTEFPFLEPVVAIRALGPIQIPYSNLLSGETVTGLLVTTPFLLFVAYVLWWMMCGNMDCSLGDEVETRAPAPDRSGLQGMVRILLLASLAAFLPILSFVFVTARYLLDLTPLLTILGGLGAWTAYGAARAPLTRWLISLAIVVSASASAVMSVLLALNNWQR